MLYILLTLKNTLYQVTTESIYDPNNRVVSAEFHTDIDDDTLGFPSFLEQENYITYAAEAAYSSLNPLDLVGKSFRAHINLTSTSNLPVVFAENSNSSGFCYSLALALEWRKQLNKNDPDTYDIFATGNIHSNGDVTKIGFLSEKINFACNFIKKKPKKKPFIIFFPKENEADITKEMKTNVSSLGGRLISVSCLQAALLRLLGDSFDPLFNEPKRLEEWRISNNEYIEFRKEIEGKFTQWHNLNKNSPKQAKNNFLIKKNKKLLKQAKKILNENPCLQKEIVTYIQQSIRSRRNFILKISIPIITFLIIGGLYGWDATRIKSKYYAFYATKWGVPVGVTEITEEQRSHKQYHYQIDTRGGRVIELSHRNSAGILVNDDDLGIAKRKYHYTENGDLLEISKFNEHTKRSGKDVYIFSVDKKIAQVSLLQQGNSFSKIASIRYQDSEEGSGKSNIAKHALKFNTKGYISQRNYLNSMNTMVEAADSNSYGYSYEYTDDGLLSKRSFINNRGIIISSHLYQHDSTGNIMSTILVDENSKLVLSELYFSKIIFSYDDYGNNTARSFVDINNNPKLNDKLFSKEEFLYNDNGNQVKRTRFGLNGKIITSTYKNEPIITYNYNENGLVTQFSLFDEYNNPRKGNNYAHKVAIKYKKLIAVEESFYDQGGKRTLNKYGVSIRNLKYDDNYNLIKESHWGISQEPVLINTGEHSSRRDYDDKNNLIELSNYGVNGESVCATAGDFKKSCYAKIKFSYNKKGNITSESYFGTNGQPIQVNGYTSINFIYDDRGNETKRTLFVISPKDMGIKTYAGHVKSVITHDIEKNILEKSFFNKDNHLAINKELGYAIMYNRANLKGKVVERAYFDTDGKYLLGPAGFAKLTIDYDSEGREIKVSMFGIDGNLTVSEGISLLTIKYDNQGHNIESANFGTDGKLVNIQGYGYAKETNKYNKQGKHIEQAFFGEGDKLIVNEKSGYAKETNKYDKQGKHIERAFFGEDNKLIVNKKSGYAKETNKYNNQGKHIERAFFNEYNKLLINKNEGHAKETNKYNNQGKHIEQAFFGEDNKLLLFEYSRYAKRTYKYNEKNIMVEEAFYGEDNNIIVSKYGYAILTKKYDDNENLIEQYFLDEGNKLFVSKFGYAKGIWKYDDKENKIEESFYGKSGLILYNNCYAKIIRHYDSDRLMTESFFGLGGGIGYSDSCRVGENNDIKGEAFYSSLDISYDTKGNEIKIIYSGVGGASMTEENKKGVVTYFYDQNGNEIKSEFLGIEERILKILEKSRRR